MRVEDRPKESNVIVEFILKRIKRGLGLNAIIVGPPGLGKSYLCMRIMERCYNYAYPDYKIDPTKHIVYELPDAFKFVREVKRPGEVLVLEEVSVMANARRSMAMENVSLNMLLDTVRKKQVILLLNAPHVKAVDKHIQRMSHLLIECMRINRSDKYSTIKAFKLTNSQETGKIYKRRFSVEGRDVFRSHFYMPSKFICKSYEEMKNKFMEDLYTKMEEKTAKKLGREKVNKVDVLKSIPTEKQLRRFLLHKQLGTVKAVAEVEGVDAAVVSRSIKVVERKVKIDVDPAILPRLIVQTS